MKIYFAGNVRVSRIHLKMIELGLRNRLLSFYYIAMDTNFSDFEDILKSIGD